MTGIGTLDETTIREAVEHGNIPTLLMVLVQLTGDFNWLESPWAPTRAPGLGDNDSGGLPETVQAEIREAATAAIKEWADGRPPEIEFPDEPLVLKMLSVAMGERIPEEFGHVLAADLRASLIAGEDIRLSEEKSGLSAVIIGAGVSGLLAAIRLRQIGVAVTVLEKHPSIGGVWFENRYPGCGVDTPSHFYSYSFAPYDWKYYFPPREEISEYLEHVADRFSVREVIKFESTVTLAAYDDHTSEWNVAFKDKEGADHELTADFLISAVGAFNTPQVPKISGLEDFEGPAFHAARWPSNLDLKGKRVGVLGTGASAMQIVPAIVDEVESVTIFQRSPQWAAPFEKFHVPVPDAVRILMREVPLYRAWFRLRLSWNFSDKNHPSLQKDPNWEHQDRSMNALNDAHRAYFARYIMDEVGGRPDLIEKAMPNYPPFGKRMLMDNQWFRTLTRESVELVTGTVERITRNSVIMDSGASHEVDVLILATGFNVTRFVGTVEIKGKEGQTLRDAWDDDNGRAYLGLAVPGFPNFFCLYGPNTQAGHGGSLIERIESQMRYIVNLVEQVQSNGLKSVEVRTDVFEEYNRKVDEAHDNMVWTHPGMSTYYRNDRGRVVAINPWRNVDYWKMTERADLESFEVDRSQSINA
jgi:4-hydroxyacetophenone monooxygenase